MRSSQRIGKLAFVQPNHTTCPDKPRDRSLTLSQNYKRLGLSSRLNAPTGGVEKKPRKGGGIPEPNTHVDPLAIKSTPASKSFKPAEAHVERDPMTGRILRVIGAGTETANPLNDSLNDLESSSDTETATLRPSRGVVADLEGQALTEEQQLARTKRPRQQSKREAEWIQRLVEVHGQDYAAMFRDRKLNSMQQSQGDIKRRVQKWAQKHDKDGKF